MAFSEATQATLPRQDTHPAADGDKSIPVQRHVASTKASAALAHGSWTQRLFRPRGELKRVMTHTRQM